ncbi:glutamate mutase subunit E [Krasilnikovia cinnamomea]|uniref:Glutamate mutase subunit E n=1 Tax=Krasilnikovia cinnamomea TaxID=349313 RepID=A0A4Q7ZRC6_9ACTN|nr:methylaspartate mutase [Krasilnikovia cinnamomea]RZU53351.1 glutamate mutase subunit E [Krasilnikovia cinnamomea]
MTLDTLGAGGPPCATGPAAGAGDLSGIGRGFGAFVARAKAAGRLVVQPRMGMGSPRLMREGLLATRRADATTVGTITIDSYTRVGNHAAARRALADGIDLNGYPIVGHDTAVTRAVLHGVQDDSFPVQVRHGSATPQQIFAALVAAGLDATEGGPVSYCLPYSRTPLRESVANWVQCCELLATLAQTGAEPHLETFGGCMMGQLCPPGLLVAISVLEAMFFRQHGVRSISLSYAQQTDPEQDAEAVRALQRLAAELLPDTDRHVVIYTYMGLYPRTPAGARDLLVAAARLAVRCGAERLIVKTEAEAHRIPTIAENVAALELAAATAAGEPRGGGPVGDTGVYAEARALVQAVLELDADLGRALVRAFDRGYLDVPYCLHPDNAGRSRSYIDSAGRLRWAEIGAMPIGHVVGASRPRRVTAADLLGALSHVESKYDRAALGRPAAAHLPAHDRVRCADGGEMAEHDD